MITELKDNQIFVFGSNLQGVHGKGAALLAKQKFGAIQGQGYGLQGQSFAIPTREIQRGKFLTLPLYEIELYVDMFLCFASGLPDLEFLVTQIGCGYAGYQPIHIAPMFAKATPNVTLPQEFKNVLDINVLNVDDVQLGSNL